MNYIISDIHGDYNNFVKLLKKINFDPDKDKIIVAGDVLDKGPAPIKLLYYVKDFINKQAMTLLMGNHEYFCIKYLEGELEEAKYARFGGKTTIQNIKKMSTAEQKSLLAFLKDLPLYVSTRTKFGPTIVTHAGFRVEDAVFNAHNEIDIVKSIEKSAATNMFDFLLSDDIHRMDTAAIARFDKYLIVGHIPVMDLNAGDSSEFYKESRYMCIDSGAACTEMGGRMSCYSVEKDEQIYV